MFDLSLIMAALAMGLIGSLHCAAMCAGPCAAVCGRAEVRSARVWTFMLTRLVGYAAVGALASASLGHVLQWEATAAWMRPLWLALHLAVLLLGLHLLWRGTLPAVLTQRSVQMPIPLAQSHFVAPTLLSAGAGLAWVAWPCGLLHAALMVSALASGPASGAAVMGAFAAASAPGLLGGVTLLRRWLGRAPAAIPIPGDVTVVFHDAISLTPIDANRTPQPHHMRRAVRLAGAMLTLSALWALGHGVWSQIRAYCG